MCRNFVPVVVGIKPREKEPPLRLTGWKEMRRVALVNVSLTRRADARRRYHRVSLNHPELI